MKKVWSSTKPVKQVNVVSYWNIYHYSRILEYIYHYSRDYLLTLLWNDCDIPILITLSFCIQISIPLGKFGDLDKIVDGNIDILCITETKLDVSFFQ